MAVEELTPAQEEQTIPVATGKPSKLPKLKLPKVDPTAFVMLTIIVGGSGLTAYLGIRFAMPQRVVVQVPSAEGQE